MTKKTYNNKKISRSQSPNALADSRLGLNFKKSRRSQSPSALPVSRLGLNLALTAFIFASPAMVAVLHNTSPFTEEQASRTVASANPFEKLLAGEGPSLSMLEEKIFLRHAERRLPRYQAMFEREARRRGLSWELLAAQAYQESHWNPRARSHTGVRGIMQLTQATSSSLGIKNRLDPVKSIAGGARHLAMLHEQLPLHIKEPDRTWIALAAYNIGMGHVKDARRLSFRLGKNPNRWGEFKEVLPLLAKKKYYRTLPHRYARGWEPVRYVERIRAYWSILHRHNRGNSAPDTPNL